MARAGENTRLDDRASARVAVEPPGRQSVRPERPSERHAGRVATEPPDDEGDTAERPDVHRRVRRAPRHPPFLLVFEDQHRRFTGDPRGASDPVLVQHEIADHRYLPATQPIDNVEERLLSGWRGPGPSVPREAPRRGRHPRVMCAAAS